MYRKICLQDFQIASNKTKASSSTSNLLPENAAYFHQANANRSHREWRSVPQSTSRNLLLFLRSNVPYMFIHHNVGLISLQLGTRIFVKLYVHCGRGQSHQKLQHFVNNRFSLPQMRPYEVQLRNYTNQCCSDSLHYMSSVNEKHSWINETEFPLTWRLRTWCTHWKQNVFRSRKSKNVKTHIVVSMSSLSINYVRKTGLIEDEKTVGVWARTPS